MRVPCGLRVEVKGQAESIPAEVMNISQKGLFLKASASSPGEALKLSSAMSSDRKLSITLNFKGEPKPTRTRGFVAWKSDLGIGVDFIEPPERLREFVSDLHESDSSSAIVSQVESGRIELD